jgi:hypothetical protein
MVFSCVFISFSPPEASWATVRLEVRCKLSFELKEFSSRNSHLILLKRYGKFEIWKRYKGMPERE